MLYSITLQGISEIEFKALIIQFWTDLDYIQLSVLFFLYDGIVFIPFQNIRDCRYDPLNILFKIIRNSWELRVEYGEKMRYSTWGFSSSRKKNEKWEENMAPMPLRGVAYPNSILSSCPTTKLHLFLVEKDKTSIGKQGKFILPEVALYLSFEKDKMLPSVKPSGLSGNGRSKP